VNPGQPIYAIGSPLFKRASIALDNGKTFAVEADAQSPSDVYIQSATLNGRALDRAWLSHSEIVRGGVLHLQLGPAPNQRWGIGGLPQPSEQTPAGR
jgi:putative alpha-1,2-mannosidase